MDELEGFVYNNFAPCGLICNLCYAYQRSKNNCMGCRTEYPGKFKYCEKCFFKNCEYLANTPNKICGECEKYPCEKLKPFIRRYLTKYNYDIREKFNLVKQIGIEKFLLEEHKKWFCDNCSTVLCVHTNECSKCGKKRMPA